MSIDYKCPSYDVLKNFALFHLTSFSRSCDDLGDHLEGFRLLFIGDIYEQNMSSLAVETHFMVVSSTDALLYMSASNIKGKILTVSGIPGLTSRS